MSMCRQLETYRRYCRVPSAISAALPGTNQPSASVAETVQPRDDPGARPEPVAGRSLPSRDESGHPLQASERWCSQVVPREPTLVNTLVAGQIILTVYLPARSCGMESPICPHNPEAVAKLMVLVSAGQTCRIHMVSGSLGVT